MPGTSRNFPLGRLIQEDHKDHRERLSILGLAPSVQVTPICVAIQLSRVTQTPNITAGKVRSLHLDGIGGYCAHLLPFSRRCVFSPPRLHNFRAYAVHSFGMSSIGSTDRSACPPSDVRTLSALPWTGRTTPAHVSSSPCGSSAGVPLDPELCNEFIILLGGGSILLPSP